MTSLRERLAQNGFESNENFDYAVRCLLSYAAEQVRALNVTGDAGRRKTAFASALAQSMDYQQTLYHDFAQLHEPAPTVLRPESKDEDGQREPSIEALDRIMSDACAFSEGERTILILDQLQVADFREHIRLYRFIKSAEWPYRDAAYSANPANLLLFMVSEEPLYHSLQKSSFRVWVAATSLGPTNYLPVDFGLGPDATELMTQLGHLFVQLGVQPTRSEYARLLHDLQSNINTASDLCQSLYGWTEGVDRETLYAPATQRLIEQVMPVVETFVGIDQVEITAPPDAL